MFVSTSASLARSPRIFAEPYGCDAFCHIHADRFCAAETCARIPYWIRECPKSLVEGGKTIQCPLSQNSLDLKSSRGPASSELGPCGFERAPRLLLHGELDLATSRSRSAGAHLASSNSQCLPGVSVSDFYPFQTFASFFASRWRSVRQSLTSCALPPHRP